MPLSPNDQARLRNWRIAHVLAALVALFMVAALAVNFANPAEDVSPPRILGVPWAIGVFWFWGWMIYDRYQNNVPTNKVAWWFILIILQMFGALMYFFSVWRPRNRPFDE